MRIPLLKTRFGNSHSRAFRALLRARASPLFPVVVGALSILSAASGLYPFGPVIIAAVVIAPEQWRKSLVFAVLGAAIGALVLAIAFHSVGPRLLTTMFPGMEQTAEWKQYAEWAARYGWFALAALAALPAPQMPALVLSTLSHMSYVGIATAILLGKLVKYSVYVCASLAGVYSLRESSAEAGIARSTSRRL